MQTKPLADITLFLQAHSNSATVCTKVSVAVLYVIQKVCSSSSSSRITLSFQRLPNQIQSKLRTFSLWCPAIMSARSFLSHVSPVSSPSRSHGNCSHSPRQASCCQQPFSLDHRSCRKHSAPSHLPIRSIMHQESQRQLNSELDDAAKDICVMPG